MTIKRRIKKLEDRYDPSDLFAVEAGERVLLPVSGVEVDPENPDVVIVKRLANVELWRGL